MTPFTARIHPSFRTGFVVWLMSRLFIWTAGLSIQGNALQESWSDSGPVLWSLLVRSLEGTPAGLETVYWLIGLQEIAIFGTCILVYRIVRVDQLPQTAERATWIWGFNPLIIWMFPLSNIAFGLLFCALGLYLVSRTYSKLGSLVFGLSMGFVPELLLVWPGVLWLTFANDKSDIFSRWLCVILPLGAFCATVGAAVYFAGDYGISLRTLDQGTGWRNFSLDWLEKLASGDRTIWSQLDSLPVIADVLLGVGLIWTWLVAIRRRNYLRAGSLAGVLPCLVWPFLFDSLISTSYILLAGFPIFVLLGRGTGNRSVERLWYMATAIVLLVSLSVGL
jgi:hypothetical protein